MEAVRGGMVLLEVLHWSGVVLDIIWRRLNA